MTQPDFNTLLHELRTRALRTLPEGARVVLSAGCSGRWYFDWIADTYPGIERHIGIEAYSPRPDDLPPGVDWIAASVANMDGVADGSVDMVFSGQNIEHLAPSDIGGFLFEAKRVLKPGGILAIDSPNRAITELLDWVQPEHVVEMRVDEIVGLCELAGFEVESVRGLWSCYDMARHRLLPLQPAGDASDEARIAAAHDAPESAFVWWLVARSNAAVSPDRGTLAAAVRAIAERAFSGFTRRFKSQIGEVLHAPLSSRACAPRGAAGFLVYGPYVVVFPGRYVARFRLNAALSERGDGTSSEATVARLDIVCYRAGSLGHELAGRDVTARELSASGSGIPVTMDLPLDLVETAFGVEFRVQSSGVAALEVALPIELVRL